MPDTPIIVGLVLVLLALAFLLLRSRRKNDSASIETPSAEIEAEEQLPETRHGVSDGLAAAVQDVIGEFTGVEANPDFPGDSDVGRSSHDGSGGGASIARGGAGDELTKIKGLGAKAEAKLKGFGVARFEQIASWTEGDIATIDATFGLAERIERDRWVEQAVLLARGEIAAFEAKFGKLG